MQKAESLSGNWNGQWNEWTPDISIVTWRIMDKLKLDNLPPILRARSDVSIDLDSRKVILPWCHFMFGLESGQVLFRADFVGWDGAGQPSQGWQPYLWSCQRLLSFQHPPFPGGTLECGELYWVSTTPAVGNTISLVGNTRNVLYRVWQQWALAAADSGCRGVLEGGIRLCKTIFRWECQSVIFLPFTI